MLMIIGITGTHGAGKGTIVEILKKKGFAHYSVRDFIVEEIKRRKLSINRDNMVVIANDLREKNSPSYIAEELYRAAITHEGDAIIESLRTPGEVTALRKKKDFYLLAVDAPVKIRYERIVKRQSSTDNVSYEKFVEDEKREMSSSNPNKQNISACMKLADFNIVNDGSLEDLNKQIDKIYNKLLGEKE